MSEQSPPGSTRYRPAPALVARLVGASLVALALVVLVLTLVATAFSWPSGVVVVTSAAGVVGVVGCAAWLRYRACVVRLDADGYVVHFVRGVGVARGRWREVREVVAAHPRDVPCLVLRRADGGSTTIPVQLLAVDRDRFADDVRTRLRHAHGR